jgi:4-hydroxy-3-methylbut-2-en-1-yl diphosphate reductase
MKVTIDPSAGFCFGVKRAIDVAEQNLGSEGQLYSLGEIVHNEEETNRLKEKGLRSISHEFLMNLKQGRVLFRAHGEPPVSYRTACRNGSTVIDATCPVVKKLQAQVLKSHTEIQKRCGAVVIFGKKGHPEVIGLAGQVQDDVIILANPDEIKSAELPPVVRLFAQTTMGTDDYKQIQEAIKDRLKELHGEKSIDFKVFNSICGQVSGREKKIQKFASEQDAVLFVAGKSSSNGKHLFELCRTANPKTFYISGKEDIKPEWLDGVDAVGISGATSTPEWLMEEIGKEVEKR